MNPRDMIDLQTYKHPHNETVAQAGAQTDKPDLDLMESDTPPSDEFALQLAPRILGFGLHDKKQSERTCPTDRFRQLGVLTRAGYLLVENIQEIDWNKVAFDRLVIDHDKKYLLDLIITPAGIEMDPEKVSALKQWQPPTTRRQLQRFLGFANFYR